MGMGKSVIFDIYKKNMRNFAGFLAFLFLANLGFMILSRERVSAAYVPTLSASLQKTEVEMTSNHILNSYNRTGSENIRLTVSGKVKAGYKVLLSTDSEETALVNEDKNSSSKISSIDSLTSLYALPDNTWAYSVKFSETYNYSPIPKLSAPNVIGGRSDDFKYWETGDNYTTRIAVKINNNLEAGKYSNKLVYSVISNPYDKKTEISKNGFQSVSPSRGQYDTKYIKRVESIPSNVVDVTNIETNSSDYEIKAWYDANEDTIFYYTEQKKIYLPADSWGMFFNFSKLKSLDLSDFDSSYVTNLAYMFTQCYELEEVNLSSFDTSKVTDMEKMFRFSRKIKYLNLSNFNTEKVTNMEEMFDNMHYLIELDISNFNTKNVKNMNRMFAKYMGIEDMLEKIYVNNDFDISNLISANHPFDERKKLRGGKGSFLVNPRDADKTWLRIDDPDNGRPGYFTKKI